MNLKTSAMAPPASSRRYQLRRYRTTTRAIDQTIIEIEVRDDSKVERLASEMRACGCVVKVISEEEFYAQEMAR
jgi:hypothetical protein